MANQFFIPPGIKEAIGKKDEVCVYCDGEMNCFISAINPHTPELLGLN